MFSHPSSVSYQWALFGIAAFGIVCVIPAPAQTTQTQTIPLSSGWNLIAFQVNPTNPAPAAVFGPLSGNFKAAFTYDAATKQWTSFQNPTTPGVDPVANALPGTAMGNIQLGKGYWVWVGNATPSDPSGAGAWNVPGTIPIITPAVITVNGWNLIGVPAGTANLTERVGLLAVLTRAGFNYDTLLKWEAPGFSFKKAAVAKTDGSTATGDTEMRFFDPHAGYWVNVTDPTLLQPDLNVTLRPDFNLEP